MKYVIEHLEDELYEWCIIEYRHISKIVGKDNLIFTNIKTNDAERIKDIGKCYQQKVSELKLKKACVLDPEAEKTLNPDDSKNFEYLVFGGILGDHPPKQRTKKELAVQGAERRNIGKEQFSTDNAAAVCRNIVSGIPIEKMKFIENIEIDIAEGESVQFPFKYLIVAGKPLVSEELIQYMKENEGF